MIKIILRVLIESNPMLPDCAQDIPNTSSGRKANQQPACFGADPIPYRPKFCVRSETVQLGSKRVSGDWQHPEPKVRISPIDSATGSLAARCSEQPEPPERLLDRRDLFQWARILVGRGPRRDEAELLFAAQKPRALGHEAMLGRDPLLDFLIGNAWLEDCMVAGMAGRTLTSPILMASAHSAFRQDLG